MSSSQPRPDDPLGPAEQDWRNLVAKALAGAPFQSLVSTTLDGLAIEPLSTPNPADSALTEDLFPSAAAPWVIGSLVTTDDADRANREILEDLAGGAGSVTLQLAAPGQFGLPTRYDAIARALDGVHLGLVPVGFLAGDQYFGALQCLLALWDAQHIDIASRQARLNADPLGTLARTGALEQDLYSTLEVLAHFVKQNVDDMQSVTLLLADGRPWHDAGASEAEELAATLATAVEYLRAANFEGVAAARVLPRMVVALGADAEVLPTIAKFRAMRLLLRRLAETLDAGEAWRRVTIEATTSQRMLSKTDCETNVLRNTLAVAAAAMGGASPITTLPHNFRAGQPDGSARRLARNVGVILQEETHLHRVVDPAGGSGAVERLTVDLARKAWEVFQSIEREGGMAKSLLTGHFIARVHETAGRRRQAIANGASKIVGVTAFRSGLVSPPDVLPHPPVEPTTTAGQRIEALAPFEVD